MSTVGALWKGMQNFCTEMMNVSQLLPTDNTERCVQRAKLLKCTTRQCLTNSHDTECLCEALSIEKKREENSYRGWIWRCAQACSGSWMRFWLVCCLWVSRSSLRNSHSRIAIWGWAPAASECLQGPCKPEKQGVLILQQNCVSLLVHISSLGAAEPS